MHFLTIMGALLSLAVTVELQLRTFRAANPSDYTAPALDSPQQVASLLDCARVCHNEYSDCFSITFNIKTGACTPRSRITYDPSSLRPAEEVFYHTGNCNTTMGFRLFVNASVIQCLYISTDQTNFTSARAACQGKDSRLYMIKSMDKLQLMRLLVNSVTMNSTWVGLTHQPQDGKSYVWEDGEPAGNVSFPIPWANDQPDNLYGGEHCVEMGSVSKEKLNDYSCDLLCKFICEKDILP